MCAKKILGFNTGNIINDHTSKILGRSATDAVHGGYASTSSSYVASTGSTIVSADIPVAFSKMRPHIFQTKIRSCGGTPRVTVSKNAYADMSCIVAEATGEVGWVGTVKRDGVKFTIEEIFLPGQRGHSATCEITTEGLGELATKLLQRPDGMEVWNSIRFWGHVHPNNDTDPSGQDDTQMGIFREACPDFFIRGILGRAGRMEFTVFLYEVGLIFGDVPWELEEDTHNIDERRAAWRETLDNAVKPINSGASVFPINSTDAVHGYTRHRHGEMVDGRWMWDDDPNWPGKSDDNSAEESDAGPSPEPEPSVSEHASETEDGVVIRAIPQSTAPVIPDDDKLMTEIEGTIEDIMRLKLQRLLKLIDFASRGVFFRDVRTLTKLELELELKGGPPRTWIGGAHSERLIRDYSKVLRVLTTPSDELRIEYYKVIEKFQREFAAMERVENYICLSGECQSHFASDKVRALLAKFRAGIVSYAAREHIFLGLSVERSISNLTPL